MAKTIEIDGVKFEVEEDIMEDVGILEIWSEIETNPAAILKLVKLVLGEDGYEKIKAHFVEKNGRMKISDVGVVVDQIAKAFPKA